MQFLNERFTHPTMNDSLESISLKDTPKNSWFAINFFTSIDLGDISESLHEFLKNMQRLTLQQQNPISESHASNFDVDSSNSTKCG